MLADDETPLWTASRLVAAHHRTHTRAHGELALEDRDDRSSLGRRAGPGPSQMTEHRNEVTLGTRRRLAGDLTTHVHVRDQDNPAGCPTDR
jgi:hypothetical protein